MSSIAKILLFFVVVLPVLGDPRKIAIVSPYSWTTPGGVNVHIEGLAEALRNRGHEVTILAPADGPVPRGILSLGSSIPISYNGSVARIAVGPTMATRLLDDLEKLQPDVIHIHEPFSPGTSLLALLSAKCPTVGTFHMGAAKCYLHILFSPILTPLWEKLNARICVSPVARSTIERSFKGDVYIIPNGIVASNYANVGAPPKEPTIAFIGRLEERKGARILIEALPDLVNEIPNVQLLIAGDGPQRESLEKMIPDQLKNHIHFMGQINNKEVPNLASKATVFCMPSLGNESFGIVLLEAMASGRPVVASDLPCYRAVLGNEAALLTPPGDPKALAKALIQVLKDQKLARYMGEIGKKEAQKYDWNNLAIDVETVYEAAIADKQRRRGAVSCLSNE